MDGLRAVSILSLKLTNTKEDKPMIHALHLIWVVPMAASFGFLIGVILCASREDNR